MKARARRGPGGRVVGVPKTRSGACSSRVEIERPQFITATRNSPKVISPSRFSSK